MLATVAAVVALLLPAAMSSRPTLISGSDVQVQLPEGLSYNFHEETCPDLERMVRVAVEDAIESDVGVVAGLLRIFFHDCFPQVLALFFHFSLKFHYVLMLTVRAVCRAATRRCC
jgi:peroxidase